MKIAVYTRDETALADPRVQSMRERLALEGCGFYRIRNAEDISSDTDIVMSVGGDGTFLSASKRVGCRAGTGRDQQPIGPISRKRIAVQADIHTKY